MDFFFVFDFNPPLEAERVLQKNFLLLGSDEHFNKP